MRNTFWITFLILLPVSLFLTTVSSYFAILFLFLVFLFSLGVADLMQTKHAVRSNYPLFGRIRYVFESLRPKIYQYFVESDLDGRPINRIARSIAYQRAKAERDTVPFGTQLDVYEDGYEWINYSLRAANYDEIDQNPRILIGNSQCKQPYSASILNISAMSFGSLSANAIMALNKGAKLGGFSHNTGEGGLSEHHLKHGGDLVWQIGTGYFGCRKEDGSFDLEKFKQNANRDSVKMIEIKLSQGAKPGHGGILPAAKITPEIAKIRGVKLGNDVVSPSTHSAFKTPIELCNFIQTLRDATNGKPVGFKLCIGDKREFLSIIKAMLKTKILPDFITVDGAEGGTGAAPLEFSNSIGTPLVDGLVFVDDALRGFGIREQIKILASGKAITGFDIVKLLSIGADAVNSARAMMLALGCIQALECNANTCPTGITTQDPQLTKGLDVANKSKRVCAFHDHTVKACAEIIGATGIGKASDLNRALVYKRLSKTEVKRYDQIYPIVKDGTMLSLDTTPDRYKYYLERATENSFSK